MFLWFRAAAPRIFLTRSCFSASSSESAAGRRLLLCELDDVESEVVRCLFASPLRLYIKDTVSHASDFEEDIQQHVGRHTLRFRSGSACSFACLNVY